MVYYGGEPMIYENIRVLAEFGKGTVIIGCNRVQANEQSEFWYVSIREANKQFVPGEKVETSDILDHSSEIYLTFPSESQMLKVMAGLSNKTLEAVTEKWNASRKDNKRLDVSE
jgi:hypothetical protein